MDVPINASIKIKGQVSEISIDSIRNAVVENLGGDIFLNKVANKVEAKTYRGDVTVKNSGGKMFVSSTTGDVVAYKTRINEIGDYFKAITQSGAITLQSVGQREVEVRSNSGKINYIGEMADSGNYALGSVTGSITLAISENTSCQIVASYASNNFWSEIPIKNVKRNTYESTVYLTGRMGEGECSLTMKTFNGSIRIRKLKNQKTIIANN